MAHLMQSQTFDPGELDSSIDFSGISNNDVKWVEGNGQWVYWKECSGLTVFEKGKEGVKHDQLTGQVKLESGIELYFVGGKVKEK